VFGWTFDPRPKKQRMSKQLASSVSSIIPFITYDYQDKAICELIECIEDGRDVALEKSRDMGASWIVVAVFGWYLLFRWHRSFLMISRKEEYVDKTRDPKSLFGKLDILLKALPIWMKVTFGRSSLHCDNPHTGSSIEGESTTGESGRGSRNTAILLDEFAAVADGARVLAATADATNCRIFTSTPLGTGNAFYKVVHGGGVVRLRMHWTLHPDKAKGLWIDQTGRPRSPWYDRECRRRANAREVAQELDIDYISSQYNFFEVPMIDELISTMGREPVQQGRLVFDREKATPTRFHVEPGGPLKLWITPDDAGRMPADRLFVAAADIGTGAGASNSTLVVVDRTTGEKVAEFCSNQVLPEEFGRMAVAICKWFRGADPDEGAFLIWEDNGLGSVFRVAVIMSGYRHFYYRTNVREIAGTPTTAPGWFSSPENKRQLLGHYRMQLAERKYTNYSIDALEECKQYIASPGDKVEHVKARDSDDPTKKGESHGDLVIADALACYVVARRVAPTTTNEANPEACYAARRNRRQEIRRSRAERPWVQQDAA